MENQQTFVLFSTSLRALKVIIKREEYYIYIHPRLHEQMSMFLKYNIIKQHITTCIYMVHSICGCFCQSEHFIPCQNAPKGFQFSHCMQRA